MKASKSRRTLWWTAVGAVGTVLAIVVSVVLWVASAGTGGRIQDQDGQGNRQYGDIVNNGNGDINVTDQFKQQVIGKSPAEARALAQKYATVAPPANGPAPYTIVGAPRGVFVRSSGAADGRHIGAVSDNVIVWADCQATTDFDPDPTDDTGALWLRIRWHTDETTDALANPEPSGPFPGWVYAGLTVPAGHNGKIPTCS